MTFNIIDLFIESSGEMIQDPFESLNNDRRGATQKKSIIYKLRVAYTLESPNSFDP
jgi:hypothetical protein